MKRKRSLSAVQDERLWRASGEYESSVGSWHKIREAVLKRDDYTCQECGFTCATHQEVHHIDGDHNNNEMSNLETLCPYCHGTQHIGFSGVQQRGSLIWLPEMTSTELINICRWLYLSPYFHGMYVDVQVSAPAPYSTRPTTLPKDPSAKNRLVAFFETRVSYATEIFKTSSLTDIATAMRALDDNRKEAFLEKLSHCKVFPRFENYSEAVLQAWIKVLESYAANREMELQYLQRYASNEVIAGTIGLRKGK